jgi:hypothetical protein
MVEDCVSLNKKSERSTLLYPTMFRKQTNLFRLFLLFFDLLLLLKSTIGQQIETSQKHGIAEEQLNIEHPNEPTKQDYYFEYLEIIARERGRQDI